MSLNLWVEVTLAPNLSRFVIPRVCSVSLVLPMYTSDVIGASVYILQPGGYSDGHTV